MDIERGFKFVFQEKNWFGKIVVGGLMLVFSFLIVPILIYYGFLVEVAQRTVRNDEQLLPDWDMIGRKIVNGFKLIAIELIYLLPFLVLFIVSFLFGAERFERFREIKTLALVGGFAQYDSAFELSGISLLFMLSSFVYLIFFLLVLPFVIGKFAERESFADAFAFSEIVAMLRNNLGEAVIVLLLTFALQIIASLGIALCFVGVLLTGFWAHVVQFYLYGNLYAVAKGKLYQMR